MMCNICGLRKAVMMIQQVTNEGKKELYLCLNCAKERGITPGNGKLETTLTGLFENLNRAVKKDRLCPVCGRLSPVIHRFPERTFHFLNLPHGIGIAVHMIFMECIRVDCGTPVFIIAYAQQQASQRCRLYAMKHGTRVVSAGTGKSQLVVRMPFSNMLERISAKELVAYPVKVFYILIEKGWLMVSVPSRSDNIEYYRRTLTGPESEELSSCFYIRIVKHTS